MPDPVFENHPITVALRDLQAVVEEHVVLTPQEKMVAYYLERMELGRVVYGDERHFFRDDVDG